MNVRGYEWFIFLSFSFRTSLQTPIVSKYQLVTLFGHGSRSSPLPSVVRQHWYTNVQKIALGCPCPTMMTPCVKVVFQGTFEVFSGNRLFSGGFEVLTTAMIAELSLGTSCKVR